MLLFIVLWILALILFVALKARQPKLEYPKPPMTKQNLHLVK